MAISLNSLLAIATGLQALKSLPSKHLLSYESKLISCGDKSFQYIAFSGQNELPRTGSY